MRLSPDAWIKRGLIVLGVLGLLARSPGPCGPSPSWSMSRRSAKAPSSSPWTRRARPASRMSTPCRRRSRGKLVRLSLEAGDRVKKDMTTVAIIEPMAPAFLDVRATARAGGAARSGQGRRGAGRGRNQPGSSGARIRPKRTRTRAVPSSSTKTISERALERARIDVDTRQASLTRAKANLDVRKRELESAQARLIGPEEAWKGEVPVGCCVTVRAPVSGRVLRLIQESERVVAAGTPLLEIGDPDNLELVVELLSVDAVKVIEGATATRRRLGRHAASCQGHARRAGRVHQGLRAGDRGAASAHDPDAYRTRQEFADRLGHEFRVFVKITIHQSPNALRVPISALFRKGEQWAVYVIERGRARAVPVEIGHRNAAFAEVLKGLPEGTAVILHPSDRIVDGVRVVRSSAAQ